MKNKSFDKEFVGNKKSTQQPTSKKQVYMYYRTYIYTSI